jgi:hypothetical protein
LFSLALAGWMVYRQPQPVILVPTLTGQPEYCLTCHSDLPEISTSHPIKTFGCVLCHAGERLALDADLAHSSMRGGNNPSDLAVVEQSCGGSSCHSGIAAENLDHIQRVQTSVQSTYAGAIANIRYTFGAQPDLKARLAVTAISDKQVTTKTGLSMLDVFDPSKETNPLIQKFAANCLTCHINAPAREDAQFARLTGCAACHSPDVNNSAQGQMHRLTTAIPYNQCNTCHNRGNYDLRTMTFVERADQPGNRLQDYYQPIAQFTQCEYTLDCVDCHTRNEAMGDGDLHSSKKDIQYVQCKTCHGTLTELPQTHTITAADKLAFKLAFLNPVVEIKVGDSVLSTDKGELLWNTRVLPNGTYEMIGKVTRLKFNFRPVMGSTCKQKPDEQGSQTCHECHALKR